MEELIIILIKYVIENGADVLVAGSYIYGKPSNQYKELIDSIR